jgi:hypothetical protein
MTPWDGHSCAKFQSAEENQVRVPIPKIELDTYFSAESVIQALKKRIKKA